MDELTEAQEQEMAVALQRAADEIRRSLRTLDEAAQVVELDQPTMGRLSRVDAIQSQQMAKSNQGASRLRLRQIEAAAQRLQEGEYGFCRSCDEPIGLARLRVRPEAVLCIDCQERQEGRR